MSRAATIAFLGVLLLAAQPAAGEKPAIRGVQPSIADTLLVCRVLTSGIPDEPSIESIESGAPAAVLLTLQLLNGEEGVISEQRIECRIVLDLWEDLLRVRAGSSESRHADIQAVRAYLSALESLPVAPRRMLEDGRRYRVRVRADSRPVAPQEEARIREWVAGGAGPGEPGQGREVSFSLGSLIRFFFGGTRRGSAEGESEWFAPEDLTVEAH